MKEGKVVPVLNYSSSEQWRRKGMDVYIHILMTSALVGGDLSASLPAALPRRPVPIALEAEWAPELVWMSWTVEKYYP
jgi:hypothetical protein